MRIIFTFIAFLIFTSLYHFVPAIIFFIYVLLSLFTFGVYLFDKLAARNGRWRIKETQLHYLAFMGGWFGAFLAQGIIKHKIKKRPFMRMFYFTVILNILFLLYFLKSEIILCKAVEQLPFFSH